MTGAIHDKSGKFLRMATDDEVLKDDEALRVSPFLMDSADRFQRVTMHDAAPLPPALHRPGAVVMSDSMTAEREALYRKRDARIQDAWKNPPPLDPAMSSAPAPAPALTNDARENAYQNYQNKLENAWRSA